MRRLLGRAAVLVVVVVVALGLGTLIGRERLRAVPTPPASSAATATAAIPSGTAPRATTTASPVVVTFCGTVTRYASDGARMLLTLTSGPTTTQLDLQYQFARRAPPADIGDRLARGDMQSLRVTGTTAVPDSGSPGATALRDFVVERTAGCP